MRAALPTALVLLSLLASASARAAAPARPHDAPLIDAATRRVPPLPPEYSSHDQNGIRFAYHPSARERVRPLLPVAEEVRAELTSRLGEPVLGMVEVRVAVSGTDFQRVLPEGAPLGSHSLAFAQLDLLVLSLDTVDAGLGDLEAALRHGLAHLAIDEVIGEHHEGVPRWLHEGFAQSVADPAPMWQRRALGWGALQGRLWPLAELDWQLAGGAAPGSVALAQAADLSAFLSDESRGGAFPRLFAAVRAGNSFDDALRSAYHLEPQQIEAEWREQVARRKVFVPVLAAGLGLWLLIAAVVVVRRRLARRKTTTEKPTQSVRLVRVRSKSSLAPPPSEREHEIPKISHDGRWHTLH